MGTKPRGPIFKIRPLSVRAFPWREGSSAGSWQTARRSWVNAWPSCARDGDLARFIARVAGQRQVASLRQLVRAKRV